jgi:hypothetical protein
MSPDGPVAGANAARNARRERGRRARWAPARDELWALLEPHLPDGARVAVVGAGNGDDLPLARIALRASRVALLDVDAATATKARGRVRRGLRRRIAVVEHDVTEGAADRVVAEAVRGPGAPAPDPSAGGSSEATPLPGGPYDVVIGDLFYSQLLFPAMLDAEVPVARRRAVLGARGAGVVRDVVARLHASAPLVVHVHDVACWGNGYGQPETLEAILHAADRDVAQGLSRAARAKGPLETNPRAAVDALGHPVVATRLWRWPFVAGVDYLVVGTVAGRPAA